jgi:hypothetical protein
MQNSFSRSTQIYECATGFAIREAASTINAIKFSAVWNGKHILEDFTFTVAGTDPGKPPWRGVCPMWQGDLG